MQTSAGYFILQDPLSAYYEALCTGLEWVEELSDDTDDLNANNSGWSLSLCCVFSSVASLRFFSIICQHRLTSVIYEGKQIIKT